MSYARAEFNFFKPEVKDISYEKIQKLVEKGNVVKLDKDGIELITRLLTSFGITDVSSIRLGNVTQLNRVITNAIKDRMPTAKPASTVPSRPATAGRADSCSAKSASEFFEKLIELYESLQTKLPDLPKLPTLPEIDMAAQVTQLFKFFQTEEVLARFAMNNATIGEAKLPIANIYTPENSIFEFSLDQLRNPINIEGGDRFRCQSFYRFFKSVQRVFDSWSLIV